MILKCAMNFALVDLLTLNILKRIDDDKQIHVRIVRYVIATELIGLEEQFSLAVELLLRFSLTCVSSLEVCLLLEE